MDEATGTNNAGLHALYSVGLNGATTTSTSRSSFASLLAPSPSTVNAISSTIVEAKAGTGTAADDSIETIEDSVLDAATADSLASLTSASATTSVAEESLKYALTASSAQVAPQPNPTTLEKPGIFVIARAMFAARVYGAAERAGIVGNRNSVKKDNPTAMKTSSPQNKVNTSSQVSQSQGCKITGKPGKAIRSTDEEKPALYDTSVHEDTIASIRERMDALLADHTGDEQSVTEELTALKHALDTAQHDLASARAENASLRAGAVRDDEETARLRDALRTAERRALALAFDVGTLTRESALKAGHTAVLEAELARTRAEAARARALVDEMKRRLEALADMQRLAGVALDVSHVRRPRYVEPGELGQPDPAHLEALARAANQRIDHSFILCNDDSDQEDEAAGEGSTEDTDDLSAELATELAVASKEQQQIQTGHAVDTSRDSSEDSIIIVTDTDTNQSSAPLILPSKAVPIEQPKDSAELSSDITMVQKQPIESHCQPIPVYHTARPTLPPRGLKAAPLGASNRLKSKPSLQRIAIANARRVSDQKYNLAMRDRSNVANEGRATDAIPADDNASPKSLRLKPLLLAARFAAAASAAGRRSRASASVMDPCETTTNMDAAENVSVTKALNPCAQEFMPRKSPTQLSCDAQLSSDTSIRCDDDQPTEKAAPKTPIVPLTLTPNPEATFTPRTTRAISVQILSARAARRQRELAQKKLIVTPGATNIGRSRENERTADSRVVSCPARAIPIRVRVSPRLPLALYAAIDPTAPTAITRYEFRSVSLPCPQTTVMSPSPAAAPAALRAVSAPVPSSTITRAVRNDRGSPKPSEVLATAQRRFQRKTSSTFGAVGPSSYWRKSSNCNGNSSGTHKLPQSSSSRLHHRRISSGKGAGSGSAKGQKARLVGKGRPRSDARRGALNELTNVVSTLSAGDKETGRWLSL